MGECPRRKLIATLSAGQMTTRLSGEAHCLSSVCHRRDNILERLHRVHRWASIGSRTRGRVDVSSNFSNLLKCALEARSSTGIMPLYIIGGRRVKSFGYVLFLCGSLLSLQILFSDGQSSREILQPSAAVHVHPVVS